jgi:pilus assembly protein CpaE
LQGRPPEQLGQVREFLVVSPNSTTREAVVSAISSDTLLYAGSCRDLVSLPHQLGQRHADFVFVDLDSNTPPAMFFNRLETITGQYVHTRVIVLVSELDATVVMQAMQAGARHVQLKGAIPTELAQVVGRLSISASRKGTATGSVLSIFSASGGCGSTTVAMNLAYELQLIAKQTALLVDLDYAYGAIAPYLGVSARYGVADVLGHPADIDPQLVSSTVARYEPGLHVLMSPANGEVVDTSLITPERLETALLACKASYGYTVVDAPRVTSEIVGALARASFMAFMVMQPSVKDIRVGKARIASLLDKGMPPERIRPILNRNRKRYQMIDLKEAQKALGTIPLMTLSNDYGSVIKSINHGKPLANTAPRSSLRREIAALAHEVCEERAKRNGGRSRQ